MWEYPETSRDAIFLDWIRSTNCVFCTTPLETHRNSKEREGPRFRQLLVRRCPACGWWTVYLDDEDHLLFGPSPERRYICSGACGSLRELDLSNVDLPIREVRDYLTAKYDARFRINPRIFEEVVASVFGDLGYESVVTGYHGGGVARRDDGIDVILHAPDGSLIGVQVKRSGRAIEVEQIRSLAGALILKGCTRGIFVTTSRFRSGAEPTTRRLADRGYRIELADANRFYDVLRLSQLATRSPPDEGIVQTWIKQVRPLEKGSVSLGWA